MLCAFYLCLLEIAYLNQQEHAEQRKLLSGYRDVMWPVCSNIVLRSCLLNSVTTSSCFQIISLIQCHYCIREWFSAFLNSFMVIIDLYYQYISTPTYSVETLYVAIFSDQQLIFIGNNNHSILLPSLCCSKKWRCSRCGELSDTQQPWPWPLIRIH